MGLLVELGRLATNNAGLAPGNNDRWEVEMAWPLCLPTDLPNPEMAVKLNTSPWGSDGTISPLPRDLLSPSLNDEACVVTISGAGGKLATKAAPVGQQVFDFQLPDILSLQRRQNNLHEDGLRLDNTLDVITVYASSSYSDTIGPASLMLCAPSAVASELHGIFTNVASALMELKDSVAHVTVRDVYGFAHLMGGRSYNRVSNVPSQSLRGTSLCGRMPPRTSAPGKVKRSAAAFELDGVFLGQTPAGKFSDEAHRSSRSATPEAASCPHKEASISSERTSPCTSDSRTSPMDTSTSYPTSAIARKLQYNSLPPWQLDDPQLRSSCNTAWHMYFQPLMQELSYVITCVPTACPTGEWDHDTYMNTLMVGFLQHHGMWVTMSALLAQTERSGIQVHIRGRRVHCSAISGKEWRSLTQRSLLQGDLSICFTQHPSPCASPKANVDLVNDAKLLQTFGVVGSWLRDNEDSVLTRLDAPETSGANEGWKPKPKVKLPLQRSITSSLLSSAVTASSDDCGNWRRSKSGLNLGPRDPPTPAPPTRKWSNTWTSKWGRSPEAAVPVPHGPASVAGGQAEWDCTENEFSSVGRGLFSPQSSVKCILRSISKDRCTIQSGGKRQGEEEDGGSSESSDINPRSFDSNFVGMSTEVRGFSDGPGSSSTSNQASATTQSPALYPASDQSSYGSARSTTSYDQGSGLSCDASSGPVWTSQDFGRRSWGPVPARVSDAGKWSMLQLRPWLEEHNLLVTCKAAELGEPSTLSRPPDITAWDFLATLALCFLTAMICIIFQGCVKS
eukprot:gene3532-13599_t